MQRTCVGCRSTSSPGELVRLVVGPEGEVVVDLAGGAFGRGAWVHPSSDCLAAAASAGLARALRANVRTSAADIRERLAAQALRRAQGLVIAARRARKLEAGATAVEASVLERRAGLVLVATDARAAAELPFLAPLVASGRAQAFGTKAEFGAWLGRPDTALLAICDDRLASEIRKTIAWTMVPVPAAPQVKARRTVSSEAG